MATQFTDSDRVYETAAGAIGQFLRVKTPGALVVATAAEGCIGYTESPILAAGPCTIALRNKVGTVKMTANGIIAAGNPCYAAAAGKVAPTGTIVEGFAKTAAAADGDIIEMVPANNYDISTAIAGTTNASFENDSDSTTSKIGLKTAAGAAATDFTTWLTSEDTLTADNTIVVPESDGDVLMCLALAQTVSAVKTHSADIIIQDDTDLALGNSSDALIRFSLADVSNPATVIALDDTSQQLHITDKAAVATDWARSAGTHPEVSIHSNTTPATDYLAIGNHDGTTCGVNVVGGTTFTISIAGTACATFIAGGIAPASLTITGGIAGPTSTLTPFIPIGGTAVAVAPTAAIPLTNYISYLDSNAGATTQTLAAGVVRGQVKKIQMAVAGNNDVVTVTGLTGGTTLTFDAVGEFVVLLWTGAAWVIIDSGNAADGDNDGPGLA